MGKGGGRALMTSILALGLTTSLATHGQPPEDPPIAVVDLHVDIPWQVHFKGKSRALTEGHARVDALTKGAYGGVVFPIYLPDRLPGKKTPATIADADAIFATIQAIVAESPAFLPLTAREAKEGKIASFLSIEGAGAFAEDITQIDRFIERGLRLVSPCHAKNSELASSATGAKVAFGLTEKGKAFAERVYQKGALIDVSHVSDATFADLVPIAQKYHAPIVATHSNARAVASSPRNLTDNQLLIIAQTGGVVGVNFHGPFVSDGGSATLVDVIKQVDHILRVAGIDHIAIGSDFDGGITPAEGLEDAGGLPRLAAALRARGRSYQDVLKMFSLNALRVLGYRPKHMLGPAGEAPAQ